MERVPRRQSLVAQTVEILREGICSGQWPRFLPGEHELTRRLQVSRATLRAAISELEREQWIRGGQGRRREIVVQGPAKQAAQNRMVAFLSPIPLHRMPPSTFYWMDELRGFLQAAQWPMEFFEVLAAYRRNPEPILEELAMTHRPAGWILYRSTPAMQQWFAQQNYPCVVAGTEHQGTGLSSVDVDYFACCRHAAGIFRGKGHRRLAIVCPESELAGDVESVAGFQDGAGAERVQIAWNDGTPGSICASLERLFAIAPSPTGLFVFHPPHVLTVMGWLQRRGLVVPRDISVVCRDDDPFLEYAVPTPTRYTLSAAKFARKISSLILAHMTGLRQAPHRESFLPTWTTGETLAPLA